MAAPKSARGRPRKSPRSAAAVRKNGTKPKRSFPARDTRKVIDHIEPGRDTAVQVAAQLLRLMDKHSYELTRQFLEDDLRDQHGKPRFEERVTARGDVVSLRMHVPISEQRQMLDSLHDRLGLPRVAESVVKTDQVAPVIRFELGESFARPIPEAGAPVETNGHAPTNGAEKAH